VAILQALIGYLARSAGKALNAIFGWAVLALFGSVSPKEQTEKGITATTMAALAGTLERHGIALRPATAPWHQTAPAKILLKIGGRPFASMATEHVEYRRNEELERTQCGRRNVWRERVGGASIAPGDRTRHRASAQASRPVAGGAGPQEPDGRSRPLDLATR
jgi:hypothetical protein